MISCGSVRVGYGDTMPDDVGAATAAIMRVMWEHHGPF